MPATCVGKLRVSGDAEWLGRSTGAGRRDGEYASRHRLGRMANRVNVRDGDIVLVQRVALYSAR